MASKSARTPNSRLFATEADDATDMTQQKPRRVKNYMKSTIFGGEEPAASPANQSVTDSSDSGSETASNDGDRQSVTRAVPTTPTAAIQKPRTRVPPGGYSSPLW